MFYDLQDPLKFTKDINKCLDVNGIWHFEQSYLLDMIKKNSYDTICHEHLEYYSIHSLEFLLKKHNLKIFNISRNTINGGSIRCFVTHSDSSIYDKNENLKKIKKLILYEKKIKIKKNYIYNEFDKNINNIKDKLISKIKLIQEQEKKIYILGASTKGNTILQFLNINNKVIQYAIERNKQKIGAKTIGSNILIVGEKFAQSFEPHYKLVLPWHFKKEIINRELNYIKNGGKLIFPLPKVFIIDKKNYSRHVK